MTDTRFQPGTAHKPNPLSFEELAKGIARTLIEKGEGPAETEAAAFERNLGWDRRKLFARAVAIRETQP